MAQTLIGLGPEAQKRPDIHTFMKESGIDSLLASKSADDYMGTLPVPYIINSDQPISVSQADFEALFGPEIFEYKVGNAMMTVAKATILTKGPDGQLYRLYMTKGEDGGLVPYQFQKTDQASVDRDRDALAEVRNQPSGTQSEALHVDDEVQQKQVPLQVVEAQDVQEPLEKLPESAEAKKVVKKKRSLFDRLFRKGA